MTKTTERLSTMLARLWRMARAISAPPAILLPLLGTALVLASLWTGSTIFASQTVGRQPAVLGSPALAAVGAVDPATGFPRWYRDSNGLALTLCISAGCVAADPVIPGNATSVASGFGAEAFWWLAESSMSVGSGGSALLVLAMEAAYLNEDPAPGDQMSFGRIRVRVISGLQPNTTYTVTHPFGVKTITTDGAGAAPAAPNTTDIGCAVGPCDFSLALGSGIGPFLVWDPGVAPAPPAGFVGDGITAHKVTGSPTGNNFFRIDGPNAGGPGVNTVQTDLFTVEGKKAIQAVGDTARVPEDANNVPINVLANDVANPGETLTVSAVTQPVSGTVTIATGGTHVIYSTNAAFTGTAEVFTYTASNGAVTDTATVNITIHGGNAAPVAANDSFTVTINSTANVLAVLTNDTDADTDLIFVSAVGPAANGTVTVGTAGRNALYTPNVGFFGTNVFTYTLSDGDLTSVGTVTVNVNRPPVAVNDTATVTANTTNNALNVLVNDSDPDLQAIVVSAVTAGPKGTPSIGAGGANVLYTPNANVGGTDVFTYTISDTGLLTATALVTVTINRFPIAGADVITVTQNSNNNPINVLANDSDPDGTAITLTGLAQPANGGAAIGPGAANIIYTPSTGFAGADPFTYTISDGLLTTTGTVTVTVNRSPVAVSDTIKVSQNSITNTVNVRANDSDPDGNTITVSAVTQPANGTVAIGTGGANVLYAPNAGFAGIDTFTYTISDGALTASAPVTVTVNRPPLPANDSVTVAQDSINNTLNVLANDRDPDGDAITVVAVSQGSNGAVSFSVGGANVIYSPNSGFAGTDSFTYTISDGVLTATATATVKVNRPPTARDDTALILTDSDFNPINVLANDTDPDGDAITVVAVSQPAGGSTSIGPGGFNVIYIHNPAIHGPDPFTYTISDGVLTATATVNLTARHDNRAPVGVNDTVTVAMNSTGNSLDVMANDSDPDANPILISAVTQGAHGSVAIGEGGHQVLYTPTAGFVGSDTFTYTISDGALTALATVAVTVQATSQPPVAAIDTVNVPQNSANNPLPVLTNDSDPAGIPILITAVTPAANGTVAVGPEGHSVIYTPRIGFSGTDTFSYTLSNGALTASTTVTITVHAANRPPVAANDSVLVLQGSTLNHLTVLANDTDPDADPIRVSAVGQAAHGSAVVPSDGDMVHYTPTPGFAGIDIFTYTVTDGILTASGTVNVTVNPTINSAPTAADDTATVGRNSTGNVINVLANDSDPEANPIAVVAVGAALNGAAAVGAGGANVLYTPNSGFSGNDAFTYTVSDGALTANATVRVTVVGNRPPVAVNDSFPVPMGSANNPLNVLANDSDPDGNSITISTVGPASNGAVSIGTASDQGALLIYTPNPGFSGTDALTYTISDGALTASATVSITVHAANNPPIAINDTARVAVDSSSNIINVLANDSDPDGDPVVVSVTQGLNGTVAILTGRLKVTYTPNRGFSGNDAFTYTISDGALTDTATVAVTVQGFKLFLPIAAKGPIAAW